MAAESLGESAIEGDSVVFVSVSAVAASSLPHAAVMPRAETAATVAAYFLMERIALSLRHSGRIPLSARAFVAAVVADWSVRQFVSRHGHVDAVPAGGAVGRDRCPGGRLGVA